MPTKLLHIPHMITEFDQDMLVPLSRNFSEIQRHVAALQSKVDTIDTRLTALEIIVAAIST